MCMNKSCKDLNFVGRKALSWWPGQAFQGTVGADLIDASYVPLLQTNGDGGKGKEVAVGGGNKIQFAWMIPCKIYRIGERDCALQTICGLAKPLKCLLASRDMTSLFLQGSSGTDSASFLGWCSWHLISSMDGRGGVLCSFFPRDDCIFFGLAVPCLISRNCIYIYLPLYHVPWDGGCSSE